MLLNFLNKRYITVFACFFLLLNFPLAGQIFPDGQKEEQKAEEPKYPTDSLGRNTPRGTVEGFISAVASQDYAKASRYLNLSQIKNTGKTGEEMARILQRLLDKGNLMTFTLINNEVAGKTDDELAEGRDRVGSVTDDKETVEIYVERTKGPKGSPIWLFSSGTLERISQINAEEALFIERIMPKALEKNSLGGVPIGQWLAALIMLVLAYLAAWVIIFVLRLVIRKLWRNASVDPPAGVIKALALPVMLYLAVWLFVFISQQAGLSIILRQKLSWLTMIVGLVAVLILLWRLTEFIGDFSKKRMILRGNASGVSIVVFLQRAGKAAVVIIGIIAILGILGIDVTAGLAALGIGGIALALGAQKTIENLVGSVTLLADRPIRVGDFCKVGDITGTIESIGMRSTRIRTNARTIVTIPNGEFSSAKIENFAHRDRFFFGPALNLRYETTPDQLRYLLVELRSILYSHPMVSPDPARVRFVRLGSFSLDIEIFAYINAVDFAEFLEVQEDLLLRIMDVVEQSGSGFAFPSQTLYMARDTGVSEEKTEAARQTVKEWKEKNDLQLPKFAPEKIEKLKDSITYPEQGSVKIEEKE